MLVSIILKIIARVEIVIVRMINHVKIKNSNIDFNSNLDNFKGIIRIINYGNIRIEKDVRVNSGAKWNVIGGQTYTSFYIAKNAKLHLQEGVGLSNSSIVCLKEVNIGKNVLIGGSCKIYDTDFHSIDYNERMEKPDKNRKMQAVIIKDGAFIGAHSIILKGVTIGKKSVVGAGSVVAKDIPDYEVWAGNPIKFIKKLNLSDK